MSKMNKFTFKKTTAPKAQTKVTFYIDDVVMLHSLSVKTPKKICNILEIASSLTKHERTLLGELLLVS